MGVNKKNAEGYQDPTAYEALTKIVKEERSVRAFKPIVYICSPFSGNIERNIKAARAYSRFAVDKGCLPIAPHLLFPQFLNDSDQFERKQRAERKGYTLRYFTEDLKEVVKDGSSWHTRP